MPRDFEPWLVARDASTVRRVWTELAPTRREICAQNRHLTLHGAALLAGEMLGERPDWIVDFDRRKADFEVDRVVDACFVDHVWDVNGPINETWKLYEQRDELRGVQVVHVGCGTVTGRPEGGVNTVVRIFDRERAASVHVGGNTVATIGDVDLGPVDLCSYSCHFRVHTGTDPVDTARALIAQLASELDASYDTSTLWPQLAAGPPRRLWHSESAIVQTFGDGERAVSVDVDGDTTTAEVHGISWGHLLGFTLSGRGGYLMVALPNADIDRVLVRLGALAP